MRWLKVFIGVMIILVAYTSAATYSDKFIYTVMAIGLAVIIKNVFFYKKKEDADSGVNSPAPADTVVPTPTTIPTSDVRQSPPAENIQKPKRKYYECKVAGVTFNNPDGSSRQKYLKDLYKDGFIDKEDFKYLDRLETYEPEYDDPSDKPFPPSYYTDGIELGTYDDDNGDLAICVMVNDNEVGSIPKDEIETVKEICFSGNHSGIKANLVINRFINEEDKMIYYARVEISYD